MSSDPDAKKSNYPVGYKKPPRHSRFKPGRSGNPRGRPKRDIVKQDAQSLFAKVANAKVTVKLHGKVIRISKEEFLMRRIFQEAEKGNAAALNYFYKLQKELGRLKPVQPRSGLLVVPAPAKTIEEWQIMADGHTKLAAAKQAALETGATSAEIEEVDQESKAKIAEIRNAEENDDEDDWGPPR